MDYETDKQVNLGNLGILGRKRQPDSIRLIAKTYLYDYQLVFLFKSTHLRISPENFEFGYQYL